MHTDPYARTLWEASVCIPGLAASTPQDKVGAAGDPAVLPCPAVPQPLTEWLGDGPGMGRRCSLHWAGCSYLEAATWSHSFAGLGFEVTLRSIKLMKGDKP